MSFRTRAHAEFGDQMWELHAAEQELAQLRSELSQAIAERDRARDLAVRLDQMLTWRIPSYLRNPGDVADRVSAVGVVIVDEIAPQVTP